MSDRKLKYRLNEFLNRIAADSVETDRQVEMIREAARLLNTEAAALEVVAASKTAA